MCASAFCLGSGTVATAQETLAPTPYKQVVSASPISILFGFFGAEYERALSTTSTVGASGNFYGSGLVTYLSADAKYRYYPQGAALKGFSLGGSAGFARISVDNGFNNAGAAFSFGVEMDYNWLLGKEKRFYVGVGGGAKRYFGSDLEGVSFTVPTLRLVNIGYAF